MQTESTYQYLDSGQCALGRSMLSHMIPGSSTKLEKYSPQERVKWADAWDTAIVKHMN